MKCPICEGEIKKHLEESTYVLSADLMIFVQNLLMMKKDFFGRHMWLSRVNMHISLIIICKMMLKNLARK